MESLSEFIINHFLIVWGIVPSFLLIYCLLTYYKFELNSNSASYSTNNASAVYREEHREPIKPKIWEYFCIGLFGLFLLGYCWLIIYGEDFVYNDNSTYTSSTLIGKNFPFPIWTGNGRFFPLGHQEFNIIRHISQSPAGYHSIAIFQLLIVILALWMILKQLPILLRLLATFTIMTTPSIVASFFGLIFPERNVIFWLSIILLCIQLFQANNSRLYSFGALLATQFSLYYKEPVFILVGSFAGLRLLGYIYVYNRTIPQKNYYKFLKIHYLECGLLILSAFFLILYLIVFSPYINSDVDADNSSRMLSVLINYLNDDKLLYVFLITLSVRLLYFLYSKKSLDFFWDFLAVGNLMYFLSFVVLQISATHYTAPVDFIAILYIAKIINSWLKTKRLPVYIIVALIAGLILANNIPYSSYYVIRRKNVIEGKVQISRLLENYTTQDDNKLVNLYFPFSSGYSIMELSTYWEYKGLQLYPAHSSEPESQLVFALKSPRTFPLNRCIGYAPQTCEHANSPQIGDLILVLPDDMISEKQLVALKQNSIELLHFEPVIPFPKQILPIFSYFVTLPDRWLHAYVLIQTS